MMQKSQEIRTSIFYRNEFLALVNNSIFILNFLKDILKNFLTHINLNEDGVFDITDKARSPPPLES